MRLKPSLRPLLATLAALVLLAGCAASPGGPPTIDRYKPILRLAVSLATDRLLTENPHLTPLTVQVSAVLVDTFDGGQFTSIAAVGAYVRAHIPYDKVGADARPLIDALLDAIGMELRVLVEQHEIPETQVVLVVREMLQWVQEVAVRHSVQPVTVQRVRTP